MKTKKFFKSLMTLVTVAFVVSLLSCASTSKKVATLEETGRMFWTLDGTDSKGEPSRIYFLGTIHVGDDRLYPLPDEVIEALYSSDTIVAEIAAQDMQNVQLGTTKLVAQSLIDANGRKVTDYLNESQKKVLEDNFGANADILANFEPWVLNSGISSLIYAKSGLEPAYGIDNNLMAELLDDDIEWEGLDELQTQFDVITFGTYEQQLANLKSTLDQIIDPTQINEYINLLYETYLSGDTEMFSKVIDAEPDNSDTDLEMQKFSDSYKKAVFNDRNEAWAKKIKKYLAEGGTTFIFAGCGHFVGDDSVFNQLKKIGVLN